MEFCRRQGLRQQTLSYWKRALGATKPVAIERRVPRPAFVPLQIVDKPELAAAPLEIVLCSGDRVRVPAGAAVEQVRSVIAVLWERC